jgi:hypothetical protein
MSVSLSPNILTSCIVLPKVPRLFCMNNGHLFGLFAGLHDNSDIKDLEKKKTQRDKRA